MANDRATGAEPRDQRLGFAVQDLEYPYFRRRIAIVDITVEYCISKVMTQGLRDRLTKPIYKRLTITPLNIPRRKITIQWRSQTWYPLRRITTSNTIKYGYIAPDGSTPG